MIPKHDKVLLRYLEAARAIAGIFPTGFPQTAASLCRVHAKLLRDDGTLLESDITATAVQKLLKRQAGLLIKLHTRAKDEQQLASSHDVDEELLRRRIQDVASIAMSKFYAYRFDRVPKYWRFMYTDALILTTHLCILQALSKPDGWPDDHALDSIVESLDRALITTGGASGTLPPSWIDGTLRLLEDVWLARRHDETTGSNDAKDQPRARAAKRQRLHVDIEARNRTFPTHEPYGRPPMSAAKKCPRQRGWSLDKFEEYMNRDGGNAWPVVFTDLIDSWPALTDRPWNKPEYLLSRTFGGRRLVPVEVGRSYVDEGWGQEVIPFRRFLAKYVDPGTHDQDGADGTRASKARPAAVGYLAQHNLFHQIPSLRNDTTVPDFCWAAVPPHPVDPSRDQPRLDAPQLNAWFGPAGTITPLHTDGYHNLLCQVVGTKYVRLYPPRAGAYLQPRGDEAGVDMSNTSGLDLGILEGWDEPAEGTVGPDEDPRMAQTRDRLRSLEYRECVLGPGDTLLIPIGWWHYVRSLSVSFSISFWWN